MKHLLAFALFLSLVTPALSASGYGSGAADPPTTNSTTTTFTNQIVFLEDIIVGTNAIGVSADCSGLVLLNTDATGGVQAISWNVMTNHTAGLGSLTTNSSPTMAPGAIWTFSLANVTNVADAGNEIVNWTTMSAFVAAATNFGLDQVLSANTNGGGLTMGNLSHITSSGTIKGATLLATVLKALGGVSTHQWEDTTGGTVLMRWNDPTWWWAVKGTNVYSYVAASQAHVFNSNTPNPTARAPFHIASGSAFDGDMYIRGLIGIRDDVTISNSLTVAADIAAQGTNASGISLSVPQAGTMAFDTDQDTLIYASADDTLKLQLGAGITYRYNNSAFASESTGGFYIDRAVSGANVNIEPNYANFSDITTGLGMRGFTNFFIANGTAIGNWDATRLHVIGAAVVSNGLTVGGAVNYAADAQADDDYEINIPDITALSAGLTVTFIANTANTDGATLEITSVGDLDAILKMHDQALATGDIEAGQVVECVFDGTNWQMASQVAQ